MDKQRIKYTFKHIAISILSLLVIFIVVSCVMCWRFEVNVLDTWAEMLSDSLPITPQNVIGGICGIVIFFFSIYIFWSKE